MFNWRSKEDFWPWFNRLAAQRGATWRYLDTLVTVSLSRSELETLSSLSPVETPKDEDDFPGPVLRWYGDANGTPVIITNHVEHAAGDVTELTFERPRPGELTTRALWPLIEAAPELF